jgi:hypothetical protein
MLRRFLLTALAVATVASSPFAAFAQDEWTLGSRTAGRVGSEPNLEQQFVRRPPLVFEAIDAGRVDRDALAKLPKATLAGIDERRFGFAELDVYFGRERNSDDELAPATLQLLVARRRASGTGRWWRLTAAEGADEVDSPLAISAWASAAHEQLRPATADASIPIVDVGYYVSASGIGTSLSTERHLIVDFRGDTPAALVLFDNITQECTGACNAFNCTNAPRVETGCRWDVAKDDFLCASTLHRFDSGWGGRRGTRFFHLLSEARVPTPNSARAGALGVGAPTPDAAPPRIGEVFTIDRDGPVTMIARTAVGAANVWILGATTLSTHFGARFFVAASTGRRPGVFTEASRRLDVRRLSLYPGEKESKGSLAPRDFDDLDPDDVAEFTPDGRPPTYHARVLARGATWQVLQITVSEGQGRGVYLLGLEATGERLVADAMLVATDTSVYSGCGAWLRPATAVRLTTTARPFTATLEIEPPRNDPGEEETTSEEIEGLEVCVKTATIAWRPGAGFDLQSWQCEGSSGPRHVTITDRGVIR